jgi:hypothetical protein
VASSGLAVGAADLDDRHILGGQIAGQSSPPTARALNPEGLYLAQAPRPREQLPMTLGRRRDNLGGTQSSPKVVFGPGDMRVFVGVHPNRHS